jgi:hypothetical protein
MSNSAIFCYITGISEEWKIVRHCSSHTPKYVLCELVFRLRYGCSFAEDKNLFISFSLIRFLSKYVAEMRFKIRTIEKSKNEFLTKVTKNSEMYYVAGVSLNVTIIKETSSK